jgi:hypothetical protein
MSGTNEKMDAFSNKAQRRQEKDLQAKRQRKKTRTIAILVILVLALLFAGAMLLNSDYIRRELTAMTISGVEFSAVEYDFFFNITFSEYERMMWETMGDFAMQLLPARGIPLRNQIQNHETGLTWAEFFHEQTVDRMARLVLLYNAAAEYGYVLREESREDMEAEMEELRVAVQTQTQRENMTLNEALRWIHGTGMNERVYRRIMTLTFTAGSFSDYIFESFSYTAEELEAFYIENRDLFDNFTYRHMFISADIPDQDDFGSFDEFEEAREEALETARQIAAEIAAGLENEDDFIAAAFEHDPWQFSEADATLRVNPGEWLGGLYGPWMRETERAYGDVTTGDTPTGTYIVLFVDRDPNEYLMTNMRQILIMPEQIFPEMFEEGALDPEFMAAVEAAELAASERAQMVYDLFVEGGATEEFLLELMEEHSDDWVEGGLYEDISKVAGQNKMVEPVESWLFAPGRRVGDFGLVHTQFGHHLLFLTEFGVTYREFIADARIRERDHEAWTESIGLFPVGDEQGRPLPVTVTWNWGFRLTQQ